MRKGNCVDCGIEIDIGNGKRKRLRCKECSRLHRNRKYREKTNDEPKYCLDCGVLLTRNNHGLRNHCSKRCTYCREIKRVVSSIAGREDTETQRIIEQNLRSIDRNIFGKRHLESCSICGSKENLRLDHDHKTLKIRGMLCQHCNLGLGIFKDNYQILQKAVNYLKLTA